MRTTPFSQIPTAPLHWLWHPYIPLGKLTLLAGDPASGKTSLALHLAASLSRGAPLPSLETRNSTLETPAATLLLSPDDNAADTLRPRLESFHANLDLIHTLPDFPSLLPTPTTNPHYLSPLQQLDEACQSIPNLALLIIDPLTHYLGLTDKRLPVTQHSALSPQHSSCLHALALLAHKHHIALLLTTRLAKSLHIQSPLTPSALHRPLGSSAFTTTPRSVLLLTPIPDTQHPSPDTPVPPTHLLLALKSNLLTPPPPLPLTINHSLTLHPHLTPDLPSKTPPAPPDIILQSAIDWLRNLLSNGPVHSATILQAARDNAISPITLNRAKAVLVVQSRKHPFNTKWYWSLFEDTTPLPRDPLGEALSHFEKTMINTDENEAPDDKHRDFFTKNPKNPDKHREFPPKPPRKP